VETCFYFQHPVSKKHFPRPHASTLAVMIGLMIAVK